MDTITQPVQTAYQEQVPPPQVPQEQEAPKKGINKVILVSGVLVVMFVFVAGGSLAYLNLFSPQKTTQNTALNSYTNGKKQIQKEVENSTVTDTSDTQINKDLDAIDKSLSSLDSGTAAIDQGFNDRAVNLQ